nr:MATE family efflux transporter [Shewanella sedimentimangrovi]
MNSNLLNMMNISSLWRDSTKHKALFALALPMMLSNITVPLLGLVDTAVIGHLSDAYYLGAVAFGSMVITLIVWLLGFLRMATTGLVAQAWGANNHKAQAQTLWQGLVLAALLGLGILLLQSPLWQLALWCADASPEVSHFGSQYFAIRIWSQPLALANLVMLGWLLGRGRSKAAMWQLIVSNLANIALDLLFVLGFHWGISGAALASVLADLFAFLLLAVLTRRELLAINSLALPNWHSLQQGMGQLLRLNRDIFIRSLCLQAAFAFMTFKGAGLGDVQLAANAVLLNLLMLIAYALDGIAYYAEVQTGNAIGRRDNAGLQQGVVLAFFWSAVFALLFSLTFLLLGPWMIALLTDITEVRTEANRLLPWLIGLPLLAFGCFLFDGVYIGASKGRVMRNGMLFACAGVFFPIWWLSQDWGNGALWLALSAFMLARSLSLGGHYLLTRHSFERA